MKNRLIAFASVVLVVIVWSVCLMAFPVHSFAERRARKADSNQESAMQTVFSIPRYTVFSVQKERFFFEMIIVKVNYHHISASFVIRDSSKKIIDSWNAKFINADTEEEETDSELDSADEGEIKRSVNVSVYRSSSPFWTRLRIPFKHPVWLRVIIEHPLLLDGNGKVQDLLLRYAGRRNSRK